MIRILRFTVVLLLLYVAWDQAMPWIRKQIDAESPGTEEGPARCVYLGDRANDAFGEQVGRVSGLGGDAGAWERFVGQINGLIEEARSGCRCQKVSCEKVRDAMTELEDLLGQLDLRFRGEPTRGDPVQRQLGVNELLNEARALARQDR